MKKSYIYRNQNFQTCTKMRRTSSPDRCSIFSEESAEIISYSFVCREFFWCISAHRKRFKTKVEKNFTYTFDTHPCVNVGLFRPNEIWLFCNCDYIDTIAPRIDRRIFRVDNFFYKATVATFLRVSKNYSYIWFSAGDKRPRFTG